MCLPTHATAYSCHYLFALLPTCSTAYSCYCYCLLMHLRTLGGGEPAALACQLVLPCLQRAAPGWEVWQRRQAGGQLAQAKQSKGILGLPLLPLHLEEAQVRSGRKGEGGESMAHGSAVVSICRNDYRRVEEYQSYLITIPYFGIAIAHPLFN